MNDGTATTVKKFFSRETSVSISIQADRSRVWSLLTNAAGYPRWNSTVIAIDGEIREGGQIELKSKLDESRTFKLKIKEFQPESRLVWGDSMGTRVYTIREHANGGVDFTMTEKMGGLLFPLFSRMIPDFDESFEQFAADLKEAAEEG